MALAMDLLALVIAQEGNSPRGGNPGEGGAVAIIIGICVGALLLGAAIFFLFSRMQRRGRGQVGEGGEDRPSGPVGPV